MDHEKPQLQKTEHSMEIGQGMVGFTGILIHFFTVGKLTVGSLAECEEPVFASTQEFNAYHPLRPNPLPPPPRFSLAIRSNS